MKVLMNKDLAHFPDLADEDEESDSEGEDEDAQRRKAEQLLDDADDELGA